MRSKRFENARLCISFFLCLGFSAGIMSLQSQLPALADEGKPNQAAPTAASSEVQKIRDEIQLKAMADVADKISLVVSDLYREANKGNPQAAELTNPAVNAAGIVPGSVAGANQTQWSSSDKPAKEWVRVFVMELDNWFPLFAEEMAPIRIPDDKQSSVASDWMNLQAQLADAQKVHQDLKSASATDPPAGPVLSNLSKSLYDRMQTMKSSISRVYAVISSTNADADSVPADWKQVGGTRATGAAGQQPSTAAQPSNNGATGGSASNTLLAGHVMKATAGLKDLHQAAVKMERTSREIIGELERWNLLWGQPPADAKNSGMLWGGGLSKEEVLSEYRNLPLTVFTMPSYVQFFSYRLPPRKKYLLIYTRNLGLQINMMAKALNAMDIPAGATADPADPFAQIQALSQDVSSNYINLLNLVEGTSDERLQKSVRADQLNFGQPIAAIYQDVEKLGALIKELSKSAREPVKSAEKNT